MKALHGTPTTVVVVAVTGALGTLSLTPGLASLAPLRDDMGNMSMTIDTSVPEAQSYFNQGLRFTDSFKFSYAIDSHLSALALDPNCAMCEWGLALAYGQNLNDALVMALEPDFLANEPLAYAAMARAKALVAASDDGGREGSGGSPYKTRDRALVHALSLRFVPTLEEYLSLFVDGLPQSLNQAYADAMTVAVEASSGGGEEEEAWPDRPMVLVVAADALMNLTPWNYWLHADTMRPSALRARSLLEEAMSDDPSNPWAIHLYIHLMEAGPEAGSAVPPAQKLERLVPGAPHLQHMPSHAEFRTGQWHDAIEANYRALALPTSDAAYPDHNMDMIMWAFGVEGRKSESKVMGQRLSAYSLPRVLDGVVAPLLPPERYLAQEALHLAAFNDWAGVLELSAPPEEADFPFAAYRFARSLAFIDANDWESYEREQRLITAGMERMEAKMDYYGAYKAPMITRVLDLISQAEAVRAGVPGSTRHGGSTMTTTVAENAGQRELDILRRAVELQDGLGYDEPPSLPVPTRLYLAAALLRTAATTTGSGEDGGKKDADTGVSSSSAMATAAVAEARSLFRDVGALYPHMGRTLLGLTRACSAAGEADEAEDFQEQFVASWRFSEIWLEDSAHVGGLRAVNKSASDDERDRESSGVSFVSSLSSEAGGGGGVGFAAHETPGAGPEGAAWWSRMVAVALALVVTASFVSLVVVAAKSLRRRRWRGQRHFFSSSMMYDKAVAAAELGRQRVIRRNQYEQIGDTARIEKADVQLQTRR